MLQYSRASVIAVLSEIIITKRQKRYKSTGFYFVFVFFLFSFVFCCYYYLFLHQVIKSRPSSVCCLFWFDVYYDYAIDTKNTTIIYYIWCIPYYVHTMRVIAWPGLTRAFYDTVGGLRPLLLLLLRLHFLFV